MNQFFDPLALAIVLGGTALAALLRAPLADNGRAVAALLTLARARFRATPLLAQVAALGRIALRHGTYTLDRTVIADPDLAAAVAAIVDGAAPETVGRLLDEARRDRIERHAAAAQVWSAAAEAAPAMGMIGTLVGLARLFATIGDPAAIGGAMAVALLATLYGALLANLVFAPVAARLCAAARAEAAERARLVPVLVALAEREQPRAARLPVEREQPRGGEGGVTDEFPVFAPARPLWLVTLADLALLLLGFVVLIHASDRHGREALAAGLRARFSDAPAAVATPPAMPVAASGVTGFAPGSAVLPEAPAALIAWAREAARDPRVTLTVTGSTDGSAADRDPASGSATLLAADRARATAAALATAVPAARLLVATAARPGGRAATVTLAFTGEAR